MVVDNLIFNIQRQGDTHGRGLGVFIGALGRLRNTAERSGKSMSKLLKAFGRVAFYRAIRSAIKAVEDALKEGLKNVYEYSKTIDSVISQAMDSISGVQLQMKNQLGAAFGELIATIQPIVEAILNLVTRVADAVSQLFALLGGRSTYHKATKSTNEWAKAAGGAVKAAKEWKNQLMGFDEINRLEEPADSGGGGGAGAENIGNWELAPVTLDLSWLDKYKEATAEWLKNLDFTPLMNAWDTLKQRISEFLVLLDKGLYWAYTNILLPFGKWVIEDAAPASVELLASMFNFLNAVLEKLAPVFAKLWEKYLKPIAKWIGDVFVKAIKGLADTFNSLADKVRNADSFKEFLNSLNGKEQLLFDIVAAITGVITAMSLFKSVTSIIKTFGTIFSTIFSPTGLIVIGIAAVIVAAIELYKHWDEVCAAIGTAVDWLKEHFGTFYEGLTLIFEGIKSIFSGLIDFIVGVFTGDWERAFNGIKEFTIGIVEVFAGFYETAIGWISGLLQHIFDFAGQVIEKITGFFTDLFTISDEGTAHLGANLLDLHLFSDEHIKAITKFAKETFAKCRDEVVRIYEDLKSKVTRKIEELKTNIQNRINQVKNVLESWRNTTSSLISAIGGFFGSLASRALGAINSIISAVAEAISWLQGLFDGINTLANINAAKIEADGSIYLQGFATGGFPEDGLFMANSGELVGGFTNGKTAVANNEEIISGIARGVYQAVSGAFADNRGSGSDKPVNIYLDGKIIARSTTRYQNQYARANGT